MDDQAIIGIDVGTTKICTLVGRLHAPGQFQILGVGIEPAQGLKKGVVVDLEAATQAIARSVDKAERTSGVEIFSALVSLAGSVVMVLWAYQERLLKKMTFRGRSIRRELSLFLITEKLSMSCSEVSSLMDKKVYECRSGCMAIG